MEKKIATLGLLVRGGAVLLGRKVRKGADIGEQTLNGPGGKLDEGQTLMECLCTEIQDEVGVTVDPEGAEPVAVITFHNGDSSVWEVHVYLITKFSGEPHDTEEMMEGEGGWWYPIQALPFEHMLASDPIWMPLALKGRKFKAMVHQSADAKELKGIYLEFLS